MYAHLNTQSRTRHSRSRSLHRLPPALTVPAYYRISNTSLTHFPYDSNKLAREAGRGEAQVERERQCVCMDVKRESERESETEKEGRWRKEGGGGGREGREKRPAWQ